MRRKFIWTTCLIIGSLYSLLISACGETEPGDRYKHHIIYTNNTPHTVVISTFFIKGAGIGTDNFEWTPGYKAEFIDDSETIIYGIPIAADSVRLVFDDTKELWYRRDDQKAFNITNPDNYVRERINKSTTYYSYTIDERVYELATDIE